MTDNKIKQFTAKKDVQIFQAQTFTKGSKWEGRKTGKDEWEMRIEGTEKPYFFSKKSHNELFVEVTK